MVDPEAFVVKGGVVALLVLGIIRLIWQDLNSLRDDIRRKPKR